MLRRLCVTGTAKPSPRFRREIQHRARSVMTPVNIRRMRLKRQLYIQNCPCDIENHQIPRDEFGNRKKMSVHMRLHIDLTTSIYIYMRRSPLNDVDLQPIAERVTNQPEIAKTMSITPCVSHEWLPFLPSFPLSNSLETHQVIIVWSARV
jgi:hypothetical protein